MSPAKLGLVGLRVSYGDRPALGGVSFDVGDGELVAVLGPSGCGKTTLLKVIAGLLPVSEGTIYIGGRSMEGVPTRDRSAALVFQHYSLFPHMSVADNVGYGLKARGVPRGERDVRVAETLALVDLEGYGRRAVHSLSGGQQQRVAMGRALAVRPDVLLMDEPLSSLDERLRAQMRRDIRAIVKAQGTTCLYVTHDQDEAMEIADRVVVLKDGLVEQIAAPLELYRSPASEYVARFLGHENVVEALVAGGRVGFLGATTDASLLSAAGGLAAGSARVLIPAQSVRVLGTDAAGRLGSAPGAITVRAAVRGVERRSGVVRVRMLVGDAELVALDLDGPGRPSFEPGDDVEALIDPAALRILRT